jgi:hypothetical protein
VTPKIAAAGLWVIAAQERREEEAKNPSLRPAGKSQGTKVALPVDPRKGKVRHRPKAACPNLGASREFRGGSKRAKVIELLRRPQRACLSRSRKQRLAGRFHSRINRWPANLGAPVRSRQELSHTAVVRAAPSSFAILAWTRRLAVEVFTPSRCRSSCCCRKRACRRPANR